MFRRNRRSEGGPGLLLAPKIGERLTASLVAAAKEEEEEEANYFFHLFSFPLPPVAKRSGRSNRGKTRKKILKETCQFQKSFSVSLMIR